MKIPSDETIDFEVEGEAGRADRVIATHVAHLSRARIQSLIAAGHVYINGQNLDSSSHKLKPGDRVTMIVPPPQDATPRAQDIPLDIVFEDSHLLVINKPPGLVVHQGTGNREGTLVNALLHHCKDSLSGIGGVLRPGIVHRLDKDTGGLMVVAKSDAAHAGLAAQLKDRSLRRVYYALALGVPFPPSGVVDKPIGRDPRQRLKMAIRSRDGRSARTHYTTEKNFAGAASLLRCTLETGRTHQIRVHMQALGFPLLGDPLYGPQPTALRAALRKAGMDGADVDTIMALPRQALHAAEIAFEHPVTGESLSFERPLLDDLSKILKLLEKMSP